MVRYVFPAARAPLRLLLHDPDVGAETHQLEEEERRVEVGGEKHARREAETEQEEEIVPPQVVVMAEILRREECRDKPHEADDRAVELAEAVEAEREVHDRDGDDPVAAEPNRRQHEREHHARDGDGRRAECALAAQTGDGDAIAARAGRNTRASARSSITASPPFRSRPAATAETDPAAAPRRRELPSARSSASPPHARSPPRAVWPSGGGSTP